MVERRPQMRKLRVLAVGIAILVVASCSSSSDPLAVEITAPLGEAVEPAAVSGPAIDEGIVCAAATFEQFDFVDTDGKVLSEEETVQAMQAEADTGEIVIASISNRWTCTDGSGTIVMETKGTLPMAEYDFEGSNEVADWTVLSGTGDYESLSGSGTITADFGRMTVVYDGELQT
jgi:hypothetical protein